MRGAGLALLALLLGLAALTAPMIYSGGDAVVDGSGGVASGPVEVVLDEGTARQGYAGRVEGLAIVFSTADPLLVAYVKPVELIPAGRVEVEARVRCDLSGAGPMARIWISLGRYSDGLGIFVLMTPTDFMFSANVLGSYGIAYSAPENPSGTWYTVKAVFAPRLEHGANVTLYLNGREVKNGVVTVNDFAKALQNLPYWVNSFGVVADTEGNTCFLDYAKAIIYPVQGGG